MNNKNCGCQQGQYAGGFVPVSGNWDFNMDGARQTGCQTRKRSACEAEQPCVRAQKACVCERQEEVCQEMVRCTQRDARNERNSCTGKADCSCDACTAARNVPCRNKNHGVGIMWAKMQELDALYDSEHALLAGTLYPELHKPLNGYWPCEGNCADCAREAAFVLWELRLYLNTHPNDKEALALFRKLCKEVEEPNYATSFLKDDGCSNGWNWVKNPWPWEYDCHCGD